MIFPGLEKLLSFESFPGAVLWGPDTISILKITRVIIFTGQVNLPGKFNKLHFLVDIFGVWDGESKFRAHQPPPPIGKLPVQLQ